MLSITLKFSGASVGGKGPHAPHSGVTYEGGVSNKFTSFAENGNANARVDVCTCVRDACVCIFPERRPFLKAPGAAGSEDVLRRRTPLL